MYWFELNIVSLLYRPKQCVFSPPAIPKKAAMCNPNLILVTTRKGGHIGFMEGLLPVGKTLMDRVLVQLATALFKHEDFLQI